MLKNMELADDSDICLKSINSRVILYIVYIYVLICIHYYFKYMYIQYTTLYFMYSIHMCM